ncbi:MAG: BON domain-containing protein [Actinomycetota bacterium]|nr:BON domain-containing protein [Actinomycetota bacterium]
MARSTDRQDRSLSARIRGMLQEHPDLDSTAVRVTARQGVVQLRGVVRTHSERLLLWTLVNDFAGVTGVDSLVEVHPVGPHWRLDDASVQQAASTAAGAAGGENVTIDVHQHVVTMSGEVRDADQRARIRHAVTEVPGVDFVRNQLRISATGSGASELPESEAWRLLETTDVGRLALRRDDGVDIFPVNYLVTNQVLYFRSGPGTKMMQLTADPRVAFEVDGGRGRVRWSVVIRGTARRLGIDSDIESSGVLDLKPWDPRGKHNYVALQPETITGRRFRR